MVLLNELLNGLNVIRNGPPIRWWYYWSYGLEKGPSELNGRCRYQCEVIADVGRSARKLNLKHFIVTWQWEAIRINQLKLLIILGILPCFERFS